MDNLSLHQLPEKSASMRRRHNSMLVTGSKESSKWLQEYSCFNLLARQDQLIEQVQNQKDKTTSQFTSSQVSSHDFGGNHTSSYTDIVSKIEEHRELMQSVDSFDFDCLKLAQQIGRENCLPMVIFRIMKDLPQDEPAVVLNDDKLINFLFAIKQGYRPEVAYHNDLHGTDVAQMMHLLIKEGNLAQVAQLNYLDLVSAVTASVCHDFDHDGFNNGYHVSFMTDRAVRYHDKAVQENWHASESMKLLL